MKSRDIAHISIKVLSIYTFIQALISLVNFISFSIIPIISRTNNLIGYREATIVFLGPFVILIGTSIALWNFADRLSNYMINQNEDVINNSNNNLMENLQAIAFSRVGIINMNFYKNQILGGVIL